VGVNGDTCIAGDGDQIRQVVFTLGIAVADPRQPLRHPARRHRHHTGIHLGDHLLQGGGILFLDNTQHVAGIVAQYAAITNGVVEGDSEQSQGVVIDVGNQCFKGGGTDQGYIAIQHQGDGILSQAGQGLHNGMAGAQLLRLLHPLQVGLGEALLHRRGAVPADDTEAAVRQRTGSVDDMSEQGFTCQSVQDLGHRRTHARALARCQDDNINRHFHLRR